jgi:hemolysin III
MGVRSEQEVDFAIQWAGLVASLVAVGMLVAMTVTWSDHAALVASAAYGTTLIATFICSILNAVHRQSRRQYLMRLLDHSVIYLLIAGTYTPFCLLAIGGRRDISLLAIVWLGATAGVIIRVLFYQRLRSAVITLYVMLGWCGVLHLSGLIHRVTSTSLTLLAIGGLLYTVGAPLHRWASLRYHDAIWHGCVFAAAACHYGAIMLTISAFHLQSVARCPYVQ